MNADQMTAVLGRASALFSKQVTPDLIAGWLDAVGDLQPQLAAAALSEYNRTGDWFPKPAEILRIANRMRFEQAREANRQHLARTGRDLDEAALTRGDGAAMLGFVLRRLKAAGSNPVEGRVLGAHAANKVAADAVEEWREVHPTDWAPVRKGRHCGREACRCTHDQGCEGGWIEALPDAHGNDQVLPCQQCNGRRHKVLTIGDPREIAMGNLRATGDMEKRAKA